MLAHTKYLRAFLISIGFLFLLSSFVIPRQIIDPVTWKTSVKKISAMEFDLVFTATLEKGWNIYSQQAISDGPIPTTFYFKKNSNYVLVGKAKEMGRVESDEKWKQLGFETQAYKDKVSFSQRIKLKSNKSFTLSVSTEYMVCKENCTPDSRDFSFSVKPEIK